MDSALQFIRERSIAEGQGFANTYIHHHYIDIHIRFLSTPLRIYHLDI